MSHEFPDPCKPLSSSLCMLLGSLLPERIIYSHVRALFSLSVFQLSRLSLCSCGILLFLDDCDGETSQQRYQKTRNASAGVTSHVIDDLASERYLSGAMQSKAECAPCPGRRDLHCSRRISIIVTKFGHPLCSRLVPWLTRCGTPSKADERISRAFIAILICPQNPLASQHRRRSSRQLNLVSFQSRWERGSRISLRSWNWRQRNCVKTPRG